MAEYKIIEPNDDPKSIVIEKSGLTEQFTLAGREADIARLMKSKQAFEAQINLENAKISNIEAHHPFVKEMSEQDRFTVRMYQESLATKIGSQDLLEQTNALLAEMEVERAEITSKLGIMDPEKVNAVPAIALEDENAPATPGEATPPEPLPVPADEAATPVEPAEATAAPAEEVAPEAAPAEDDASQA